jgi:hypothetical protein
MITFVEPTDGDWSSTGSTAKLQSSMSPSSSNSVELKKTAIKGKKLYSFQESSASRKRSWVFYQGRIFTV